MAQGAPKQENKHHAWHLRAHSSGGNSEARPRITRVAGLP